ncbi:hypothetical protein JIG36_22625 [Actinoplanes sp. LDG1-06]|uniref:Uncharacterized protein n=1 Tax=Paractinoplanes ovalisporus TaxID=2810368 RepID=A0ABS2AEV1_9ACTN|nr:hypothetical protein [Actinoplanes ovalisporus]MBM2618360.1 hypothetical protein [Actinoplanes ovalisporus]
MSDLSKDTEAQLEEIAEERMEELPGETALGHRDPAAGGEGEPQDFKGNEDVTLPE